MAHPIEKANIISRLTFWWMTPLIALGFKRPLEPEDLYPLAEKDTATSLGNEFQKIWESEKGRARQKGKKPSLLRSFARFRGLYYVGLGIPLKLGHDLLQFCGPVFLRQILSFLASDHDISEGFIWAFALFLAPVLQTLVVHQYFHVTIRTGMHARAAMVTAIYRKALSLDTDARTAQGHGKLVNLMSNDATRLQDISMNAHMIWSGPFQIFGALFLLIRYLGWAPTLSGFVLTIVLIPVNAWVTGRLTKLRRRMAPIADERVRRTNEILQGIRVVKMSAWEEPLSKQVMEVRGRETGLQRRYGLFGAFANFLAGIAPILVTLTSFAVYVAQGNPLTADVAFPALSLFGILRFPLNVLPRILTSLADVYVAIGRLGQSVAFPSSFLDLVGSQIPAQHRTGGWRWGPCSNPAGDPATPLYDPGVAAALAQASFAWTYGPAQKGQDFNALFQIGQGQATKPQGAPIVPAPRANTTTEMATRPTTQQCAVTRATMSLRRGDLMAVVGPVGCGKSSLLASMLGELHCLEGEFVLKGKVAYVPQTPWILNATVQDNITFGLPFDPDRYAAVLRACCLEPDIAILPAGDKTEIGEKGINLSGGQKQRIAMARAAYSQAEVFILDDPLSAVDLHVGQAMMDECIIGMLKNAGKTVVLATHHVQHLNRCDLVALIGPGGVLQACGSLDSLIAQGFNLQSLAEMLRKDDHAAPTPSPSPAPQSSSSLVTPVPLRPAPSEPATQKPFVGAAVAAGAEGADVESPSLERRPLLPAEGGAKKRYSGDGGSPPSAPRGSPAPPPVGSPTGSPSGTTVTKVWLPFLGLGFHVFSSCGLHPAVPFVVLQEERATGSVSWMVYLQYIRSGGWAMMGCALLCFLIVEVMHVCTDLWLAHWSDATDSHSPYYLLVYASFSISTALLLFLRGVFLTFAGRRAGATLHNNLIDNILQAPLYWYETTPTGRILNRFSKDMDMVDVEVQNSLTSYLQTAFTVIGSLFIISRATLWFLLPLAGIAALYFFIQQYYRRTSRELQRLESISRTPVFHHFQQSLNGLASIRSVFRPWWGGDVGVETRAIFGTVIGCLLGHEAPLVPRCGFREPSPASGFFTRRAFDQQERFCEICHAALDKANRAYFLSVSANRWLAIRVEFIGTLSVVSVALLAIVTRGSLSPGLAGVALSMSLSMTGWLGWFIRSDTDLETKMNSVERILEYTRVPREAPRKGIPVPATWPSLGDITVDQAVARYRPGLPTVLNSVNLHIQPAEKVGIVGRTGAGKSSLLSVLLRLVELEAGTIRIDGLNIRDVGLDDLRKRIAVIPQDPFLFEGTVRTNLDPFKQHTDAELWAALEGASLKEKIQSLPYKLDSQIREAGENFSAGERQLLCLARALLRRSRILLMDEATAAVDFKTDALIQQSIRQSLRDQTVLIVAHRLATVVDVDSVVVMDAGRVGERGRPRDLLQSPSSLLYDMAASTGAEHLRQLQELAQTSGFAAAGTSSSTTT
ncbi:Multidrug resistance-associated protein [Paratrimastix pyriformis]|uniref:Multidrug resistance-associated protein n=1 Tax=Paratrimastix pyriformis TaxID=342808 RepID=A0ABQ8UQM7_9EUKA|nr:Multidrug resistance-associated protein [Paratrimastix pyriformis]